MKFLHSPSSSSSTTEFHSNYSPTGCIPALLRRLLCFHTLPTFPLDTHIKQSFGNNELEELYCADKLKGNPGIVAKLMGLDSMPAGTTTDESKLKKKGKYVLAAPTFVEVENEKFIILSFEGGGKDKELRLHSSKNRKGLIESKEKARNRMNQETPTCQSPENNGGVMNSCQLSNLGKNSKKLCETDSDSENYSPVSVLEFSDHQEASYSGKEELTSRRKLRGDLDRNAPSPSSPRTSSSNSVDDGEESCRSGKEYVGLEKKGFVNGESKEMWEEICQMVERDVMDSSRVQMERWKGGDIEEIGVCFGSQILDQLILELLTTIT